MKKTGSDELMKEILHTYRRGREIVLLWRPDENEIDGYIYDGFVPIEMAEGTKSYVDHRRLDHHNDLSALPSACITALDHYGELADDSPARIMVNHTDSDSVMTGLTLLGLLPSELLTAMNPEIGILDTEPLLADKDKMKYADVIDLWKSGMGSVKQSGWSYIAGIDLWLDIIECKDDYTPMIEAMKAREETRRAMALEDHKNIVVGPSGRVALVPASQVKGPEIHLERLQDAPADTPEGWRYLCTITRVVRAGNVMLTCPCVRVAEYAFGPGGLKNVFPKLPPIDGKLWGGRESVGGSPRGIVVPETMLDDVMKIVDGSLINL